MVLTEYDEEKTMKYLWQEGYETAASEKQEEINREKARADAAEAELAELRKRLAELEGK